jgi:hypothetical protein
MTAQSIAKEIAALPPAMRREVVDFIVFLRQRRSRATSAQRSFKAPLKTDPFVGMWTKRDDLTDSARWVRETRRREWGE